MANKLARRSFMSRISLAIASTFVSSKIIANITNQNQGDMNTNPIKRILPLGFQWDVLDPFLFCVHHEDNFPKGNEHMAPVTSMEGRHLGDDFIIKDGFRMYHGKTVPGFPGHPHRGFETVTVVRKGIVDHADSLGAAGRYGNGDVQWMTAGKGVQHSEMFPLIHADKENTMELFQIWLNLPKKNKMVEPHFKMLWRENMPIYTSADGKTKVEVIAGKLDAVKAGTPPPDSWASDANNHVNIWNIKMQAGAEWIMPASESGLNTMLYFYEGHGLQIAATTLQNYQAVELMADRAISIKAGDHETSILILQGKPIGEQVMQYGPFVMNTKEEINQAFEDYHKTQFGGWPWSRYDQVHDRNKGRFAKHADGKVEEKMG